MWEMASQHVPYVHDVLTVFVLPGQSTVLSPAEVFKEKRYL